MKSGRIYKKVVISDKGADFITEGNNWVYENEVVSFDEDISNGEIVDVLSLKDKYLGSGFYSAESKVKVRIFSSNSNDVFNDDFFIRRVRFAIKYRLDVLESIGSCRVIFGEADGFPGLTVDKYNDILVSQITTIGLDIRKDIIFKALIDEFAKIGFTTVNWLEITGKPTTFSDWDATEGEQVIANKPDLSEYATKAEVNNMIGDIGTRLDQINGAVY